MTTNSQKQTRAAGEAAHTAPNYNITKLPNGYAEVRNGNKLVAFWAACQYGSPLRIRRNHACADEVFTACNSYAELTEEAATLTAENAELEKVVEAAGVEIDALAQRNAALVAALERTEAHLSFICGTFGAGTAALDVTGDVIAQARAALQSAKE